MLEISKETRDKLTVTFCRKHQMVPFRETKDEIFIYVNEVDDILRYNLQERLSKKVSMVHCTPEELKAHLEKYFHFEKEKFSLQELFRYENLKGNEADDVTLLNSPVVKFLNYILNFSIEKGASDIHFEIFRKEAHVRYRIDGFLHTLASFPIYVYPYLISRIKILSHLDITEKRIPQDGRFTYSYEGRDIDIRVAISPTSFGEKVVFRILDANRVTYTAEGIGLKGSQLQLIENLIAQPSGMILFCGPTSSGDGGIIMTDTINQMKRFKASTKPVT